MTLKNNQKRVVSLQQIVGKNYADFWRTKKRYRVCKGSRGSKKSKTTALWIIVNIMKHKDANALVVKRFQSTCREIGRASCRERV